MRTSPQVRRLAVVSVAVLGVLGGALVGDAPGHEDTGGPARVNDSVKLTEVTALSDQDDGLNGLSEYCIRVTIVHPDHIGESESVDCVDVNWDDTDKKSGRTWEQIGSLPLIGPGGYAGSSWESVDHTNECVDSAPWTLRTRLTEANTFGLADILAAIGDALTQGNASGAAGGKLFLYGEAAKIAAKILRELFADLDNLGAVPLKWEAGEGDPGGTVPKGPDEARHFKASGEKTVTRVSPDCTSYKLPTPSIKGAGVVAQMSQAATCGSDERHILCKRVTPGPPQLEEVQPRRPANRPIARGDRAKARGHQRDAAQLDQARRRAQPTRRSDRGQGGRPQEARPSRAGHPQTGAQAHPPGQQAPDPSAAPGEPAAASQLGGPLPLGPPAAPAAGTSRLQSWEIVTRPRAGARPRSASRRSTRAPVRSPRPARRSAPRPDRCRCGPGP